MAPPFYRSRPTRLSDLVENLTSLLPIGYGQDPLLHQRLPKVWEAMMQDRDVRGVAIESQGRLVATNLRAIVSLPFLRELQEDSRPLLGERIVRRFLEVGDEPLDFEGVRRRGREEGVGVVLLHSAYHGHQPGEMAPLALREYAFESSLWADRGYPLRAALREVYSPTAYRWFTAAGYRLQNDFGAEQPSLENPFRLIAEADDPRAIEGYRTAMLFAHHPPRLGLRRIHRELLEVALADATDEEIANTLCLSLSSVKQRWRTLYDHLDERSPELLGDLSRASAGGPRRGPERRRRLLSYLREHPEELQPWLG